MSKSTEQLVVETLTVAVPLWQIRLINSPWSRVVERRDAATQTLADKSEHLGFQSGKKGDSAAAFNALAEALAILSFCPGGVHFMGCHWVHLHPEQFHDI